MTTQNSQWMLFGVDVRRFGHMWLASWRDFLFAVSSPVRARLDEPVLLKSNAGDRRFQGLQRLCADTDLTELAANAALSSSDLASPHDAIADATTSGSQCYARLLPDDLVLTRTLSLPLAVESDLEAVLAMEISACSPFATEDSVYGFLERDRDASSIHLSLAIASRSAVARWRRELLDGDAAQVGSAAEEDSEIWARVEGGFATITGFGESRREQAYKKRLVRSGLLLAGVLLLVLLSASVFAIAQGSKLERAERLQSDVQQQTRSVSEMREVLAAANDTIRAANAIIADYPNPHVEIARLTELMNDEVYVAHFTMRGRDIRVRGRATDAAQLMQTLAETPEFSKVTAPQAITAVGNTGLEQFHLDIELASTPSAKPSAESPTKPPTTSPETPGDVP